MRLLQVFLSSRGVRREEIVRREKGSNVMKEGPGKNIISQFPHFPILSLQMGNNPGENIPCLIPPSPNFVSHALLARAFPEFAKV